MKTYLIEDAKHVLICPLNWGLGHATRCVPIIEAYIENGSKVTVVADAYPLRFLQNEFPQLQFIEYPSYPVTYSKGKSQVWTMIKLLPRIIKSIYQEHKWINNLLDNKKVDLLISDNRFGLWSKKTKTAYITHQVMVKMPKRLFFLEHFVYRLHRYIIEKYDYCWIPDYEENGGLSGDLSHKYPLPRQAKYIGTLSRFEKLKDCKPNKQYQNIVILSGVEPQRTIFEKEMIDKLESSEKRSLILLGKPNEKVNNKQIGNIEIKSHIDSLEFAAYLKGCETIICRSGYSTIMDLDALGVLYKAQFHPTPGQTEQEYLATYLRQ